jgi:cobalt-precorrin 5A hydrolase/precorrin-3B C17-methyltransferase
MASLVFERIELAQDDQVRRSEITVLPGISAMFAAAARIGAPLGHDFCAISLSDLLTPWEAIESRLRAAAHGDFVVALYNPASQRRRGQLERAVTIIGESRGYEVPVVVARQVGRSEESITVTALAELDQDAIDMMTLLIIGSSQSRRLTVGGRERVYTPRGYRGKSNSEAAE